MTQQYASSFKSQQIEDTRADVLPAGLENEDESGRRLCEYWRTIFKAREGGPRHHQHKDILRNVQHAPGDIRWTIDQAEFDDLHALKKDSAPGPDGIPHGANSSLML